MSYEPKKASGVNKHVVWSNSLYVIGTLICLFIAWRLEAQYEVLDPSGALVKFILGKSVATICGLTLILGVVQYADTKTRGALMRAVCYSPYSAAAYLCMLMLVGALVYINYQ